MCGIIGIVGRSPVQARLIESLKRLEYRGYDSAGIAGVMDGKVVRRRAAGKIRALEEVGFLDRAVASGSTHRPTPDGLHRKPVLFMFGSDYGPLFSAANRRAAAARERRSRSRPAPGPAAVWRPSVGFPAARPLNSPKGKGSEAEKVIMGEIRASPPPISLNPNLEAALERWKRAAERQGLIRSG